MRPTTHAIVTRTALFTLLLLLAGAGSGRADTFDADIRPAGSDGDLLKVTQGNGSRIIRLYGVACPLGGQPHAEAAVTYLLESAMDARFAVEVVAEDATGTPVAWIRPEEGPSLNEQLVRRGLAWWDRANAPAEDALQTAARDAIAARAGLWADAAPLAPWDYRVSHGLAPVRYKVSTETPRAQPTVRPPATTPAAPAPSGETTTDNDYFPTDPQEHFALMLKHQPQIVYDKQGRALGLTATDIAAVPGARRIGLQDGDIVQSVNGIALTSEAQVLGLVGQLQGVKQLDLKVFRNGKQTDIVIPLE